jgi:protocatechuate 3,4-dioxygenase beta subunit
MQKDIAMNWKPPTTWTRSRFLRAVLVAPAAYVLAACTGSKDAEEAAGQASPSPGSSVASSQATAATEGTARPAAAVQATGTAAAQVLAPTPQCVDDDDDVTPAQTEGPYFTPNSPERASLLEPGMAGTRLLLTGYVLSTACRPVAGALLDFWQADDAGEYDNAGYRLRGHQFTDNSGRYTLETIVPGLYPGRTRHIHLKVQAPNQPILTTQLYFPGEARNRSDRIFHEALVVDMQQSADGFDGAFNFVLDVG